MAQYKAPLVNCSVGLGDSFPSDWAFLQKGLSPYFSPKGLCKGNAQFLTKPQINLLLYPEAAAKAPRCGSVTVSLCPTAPSRGRLQLGKTHQQNHQLGINPIPRMPLLFPQLQTSARQDKRCILAGLAVFPLKHPEVTGKHLHGTASPSVYPSRRRSAEMHLGLFSQVTSVRTRGNYPKLNQWGLDWILQKKFFTGRVARCWNSCPG